jgi:hypothetical protein
MLLRSAGTCCAQSHDCCCFVVLQADNTLPVEQRRNYKGVGDAMVSRLALGGSAKHSSSSTAAAAACYSAAQVLLRLNTCLLLAWQGRAAAQQQLAGRSEQLAR